MENPSPKAFVVHDELLGGVESSQIAALLMDLQKEGHHIVLMHEPDTQSELVCTSHGQKIKGSRIITAPNDTAIRSGEFAEQVAELTDTDIPKILCVDLDLSYVQHMIKSGLEACHVDGEEGSAAIIEGMFKNHCAL